MAGRYTPPFPLRKSDYDSKFIPTGLVMAYPMLEGSGNTIHNFGSWGSTADLTVSGGAWTRRETGLQSIAFKAAGAVVQNTTMQQTVPENWSWAAWMKLDSLPTITSPHEIFSFRTADGTPQVRAWADTTGVWSWQKGSINDHYSVLYPASITTMRSGPVLLISTYAGNNLAPVQLITTIGMSLIPTQPTLYQSFSSGLGDPGTTLDRFTIGNDNAGTSLWDGVIGPFYFWDRVISNSEIWELWQDPYAPFRTARMNWFSPTTMRSSSGFSLTGLGKTTGPKTIIQSEDELFIPIDEDFFYMSLPVDEMEQPDYDTLTIDVGSEFTYQAVPTDSSSQPSFLSAAISVDDSFIYVSGPTDLVIPDLINPPIIDIDEPFAYDTAISDEILTAIPIGPLEIDRTDDFAYPATPNEVVSQSIT